LGRRRRRLARVAGRLIECVRAEKSRNTHASVAHRLDIGKDVKAFETRTGFMRAFRVFFAAFASVPWAFRRKLVAVPHLDAMRMHRMVRRHRMGMRVSRPASGCFRAGGHGNAVARVQHQAHCNQHGQEDAHCRYTDLSRERAKCRAGSPSSEYAKHRTLRTLGDFCLRCICLQDRA
jgi:hypothetical protein